MFQPCCYHLALWMGRKPIKSSLNNLDCICRIAWALPKIVPSLNTSVNSSTRQDRGHRNMRPPFHQFNTLVWLNKSSRRSQWRGVSYPGLQLGGELGLELAHGAVGIISLNEDFGSDGCLLPHVLQAVSLWKQDITADTWSHFDTMPLNMFSHLQANIDFHWKKK